MIEQLRVLSELLDRARSTQGPWTFDGRRDVSAALGYATTITAADYRERYRRGGIASRIIEAKPQATWRGLGEIIEDEDPSVITPFEQAWIELEQRLKIWSVFYRVDVLAGLGRFAVILIGAPGEFDQELPRRFKAEEILYLTPFSEVDIEITDKDYVLDRKSPRFGLIERYRLGRLNETLDIARRVSVHWSRVIHVADGALDDQLFGLPRLERVWNRLDDLEKVIGGGSEAFWLQARQGLHFNIDKELKLTAEEKTAMVEQVDEYVDGIRRTLRTRGMEVNTLGSDVANFNPQADSILTQIAGAAGIPKRILTGSEMGELASAQDRSNWADQNNDRRSQYASPVVVEPFVQRMIDHDSLPMPVSFTTRWPETLNLTPDERAKMAVLWADINAKFGLEVVTANEIRDRCLSLNRREELDEIQDDVRDVDPVPLEEEAITLEEEDPLDERSPRAARLFKARVRLRRCKLLDQHRRAARTTRVKVTALSQSRSLFERDDHDIIPGRVEGDQRWP